jgi:hypothetical protein
LRKVEIGFKVESTPKPPMRHYIESHNKILEAILGASPSGTKDPIVGSVWNSETTRIEWMLEGAKGRVIVSFCDQKSPVPLTPGRLKVTLRDESCQILDTMTFRPATDKGILGWRQLHKSRSQLLTETQLLDLVRSKVGSLV